MKKIIFIVSIVIVAFSLSYCQNESVSNSENLDLFSEMENQYEVIQAELDEYVYATLGSYNPTRSELVANIDASTIISDYKFEYDETDLEDWIQKYLAIYYADENVLNWNEQVILEQVQNDETLTAEQKILLAKSLAYGFYIKTEIGNDAIFSTRATAAECRAAFDKAVTRACRNFVVSGFLGLATGGFGTAVATVVCYIAVDEAEKDYNKCMKTAK